MQTTQTAELRAGAQLAQGRRRVRLTHLQKRNLWGFAFAVPALCLFALFSIYPIARTFFLSFFDYSVVDPPHPVGLENYRQILGDQDFTPRCSKLPLRHLHLHSRSGSWRCCWR